MKTLLNFIYEAKQNFLVKGHTKDQTLKNRLCDFLQFYIDCFNIGSAPKDIFTLSKSKMKTLFACTNLPYYYKSNKLHKATWKNYDNFYDWLMEHKNDELEEFKEDYHSSSNMWGYSFKVETKYFNFGTTKSFTKQRHEKS